MITDLSSYFGTPSIASAPPPIQPLPCRKALGWGSGGNWPGARKAEGKGRRGADGRTWCAQKARGAKDLGIVSLATERSSWSGGRAIMLDGKVYRKLVIS